MNRLTRLYGKTTIVPNEARTLLPAKMVAQRLHEQTTELNTLIRLYGTTATVPLVSRTLLPADMVAQRPTSLNNEYESSYQTVR